MLIESRNRLDHLLTLNSKCINCFDLISNCTVFSLGVMNREYQLDAQTSVGRKVKVLNHFYKNIAYIKPESEPEVDV